MPAATRVVAAGSSLNGRAWLLVELDGDFLSGLESKREGLLIAGGGMIDQSIPLGRHELDCWRGKQLVDTCEDLLAVDSVVFELFACLVGLVGDALLACLQGE